MDSNQLNKLEENLSRYRSEMDKNFAATLNEMINDLDPTINANEYSKNYSQRVKSDPFYYLKFQDMGREKALEKYQNSIENIIMSTGSRYFTPLDYNIGIIADEFLYNSFKDVANIEYISWNETEVKNFDFVIFATTWKGIDNSWEGVAHPSNEKRDRLIELIEAYNKEGVPTVFYSKEDPVNFHLFKSMALHCKYIFTSALESVKNYIEYTGNKNVNVLQFGINPYIHNPVGSRGEAAEQFKNDILFAGSWLSKYPVRMNETQKLFDAIKSTNAPFTIIDRNLRLENPRYQFPSKYLENLAPPVIHDKLMKLHKVLRWSINMNSVKYSETMFANRVYELQAFGNILLSNYNTGINNMFPNIRIVNTASDFNLIYRTNEKDLRELQAKGIRNVFKEHTTFNRIQQIGSTLGLKPTDENDSILVVLKNNHINNIGSFNRQIYKNKTMILMNELSDTDIDQFAYITFFDEDYLYEEYYLEDMVTAFKYTDVDFVTKNDGYESHNYIDNVQDNFKTMFHADSYETFDTTDEMSNGYNLDDVELVNANNDGAPLNIQKKELSVIVPIHNNGTYLEEKCFASLKRSSSFNKMEIIFVNDGSTDETTVKIIERLRRRHPDIVYIENEAGSGSASKPRNQGVRAATTDYITYLDPDNEAIGDGYHNLLDSIKNNDVDMVVGNIIKEDSDRRNAGKYTDILKRNNDGKSLVTDPKEFLIRSELRVQSIQALIVRKSVIIDNDIKMVEGAAGQDTMFYQELVLNSKSLLGVSKTIHVYYAAVSGSVTNTVSPKFFNKYLKLEKERLPYLERYGLVDVYLNVRFNSYVRQWYLTRLNRVPDENRIESIKIFLEILKLYDKYSPRYDEDLKYSIEELKSEISQEDSVLGGSYEF